MREIKFRIWDIKNKCWLCDGKYNQYIPTKYGFPVMVMDFRNIAYEFYDLDDVEVMQFTGVKDKNSVEIYEGDIVILNDSEEEYKCLVKYKYGSYILENRHFTEQLSNTEERFLEVVGNIWENKDLLEG